MCELWIDDAWSYHVHHKFRQPTLDEMIMARRCSEMGAAVDALQDVTTELTKYFRTGKEPMREKPF